MDVLSDFGVNGINPSVVNASTTRVQYFARPSASFVAKGSVGYFGNSAASPTPSATSAVGQLAVPGRNKLNGQVFNVIAAGDVVSGSGTASETVEIALYAQVTPGTSPSYTKIATTGSVGLAPTVDGIYYSWLIDVALQGTSASGIVGGYQFVVYNGAVEQAGVTLTATLSGINFDNGYLGSYGGLSAGSYGGAGSTVAPPFGLVVGVTFSSANSGNVANLYQFQLLG